MSRYIDAEPLEHRSPKLRALIKEQPTADVVEVRHGTNKGYEDSYGWKDVCSLCGCEFRTSKSANYCPNCGARMDRTEAEEMEEQRRGYV